MSHIQNPVKHILFNKVTVWAFDRQYQREKGNSFRNYKPAPPDGLAMWHPENATTWLINLMPASSIGFVQALNSHAGVHSWCM